MNVIEKELRILMLEDLEEDAGLVDRALQKEKIAFTRIRVDTQEEFTNALENFKPDVILSDHSLPQFNSIEALKICQERKLNLPFILVTGVLSEHLALECINEGIDDFVLKSSFKRLPAAIIGSMRKKEMEDEKNRFASALKKSHEELRLLVNRHQISIEEERMNIARDLHDELGQVLTALKISAG